MREAVAWVNNNARNPNGTVGWRKVVDHFTHWELAGEDTLPITPSWFALATKGNTLCQRYRTCVNHLLAPPSPRKKVHMDPPSKVHLQLPKAPLTTYYSNPSLRTKSTNYCC